METVTSKFQYIVQGDRRAVNKSQGSLNVVKLFQLPRSRDILTAVLFLIRAEPDNGDLRVFCNPVSQDLLLEIQHSLGVLVQFDPPVRQTGRFLDSVSVAGEGGAVKPISWDKRAPILCKNKVARPKAVIPVFPGTNCEYDTAKAFARAGADPEILVIRNLTPADVTASCEALVKAIGESQIVMLPGGFSGGDEPDGSAKLITSFFRAAKIKDQVHDLLKNRDGLMLGICNGFQALIKLGLVPYGEIRDMDDSCPTLTFNLIGRHQSRYCDIRVASVLSPWMLKAQVGDIYTVPISHGEGRFVAPQAILDEMIQNGQIATQYVDANGVPSMDIAANPNGSIYAIEGIFSPDGRIFGKMGHTERWNPGVAKNIPGEKLMPLFESGAEYFR